MPPNPCPPLSNEAKEFLRAHIEGNDSDRLNTFISTIGQADNPTWFAAKKYRISASKSRQIAYAQKEDTLLKYFAGSAVDSDNLRYGRETEPAARQEYSLVTSNTVHDSGLIIARNFPWLCASPDGLVCKENELIVLEIKCPISGQDGKIDVPYIVNGALKKSHPYYAQVQIQLFVSDAQLCHFYVYGTRNSNLIIIERDDKFC